ncbi:MAG: DUF4124 domain-containing protein [Pseudomonadota bacterium]
MRKDWMQLKTMFIAGGALLLTLAPLTASAAQLFRYKDTQGSWVIASSVPAERVPHGYHVLDATGRVVKTVAPQPSEEEREAFNRAKAERAEREAAERRVNLLYGSEEDIDHALSMALQSIDTTIENTRANILHLESQRSRLEGQAARIERAGNTVPEKILNSIATMNDQLRTLEREVEKRVEEKEVERERHAADREVFRSLRMARVSG